MDDDSPASGAKFLDYSTPHFQAALRLSRRHLSNSARRQFKVTDHDVAEMIVGASKSLWYSQLTRWAGGDIEFLIDTDSRAGFTQAAAKMKDVIDLGWNPESGWWHMPSVSWGQDAAQIAQAVVDFVGMADILDRVVTSGRFVPTTIFIVIEIILGPGWRRLVKLARENPGQFVSGIVKMMSAKLPAPETKPCINPFCANGPAGGPAQVRSGACCKECEKYECAHPQCVKRAAANGWPRAHHPYVSNIGRKHLEFRRS